MKGNKMKSNKMKSSNVNKVKVDEVVEKKDVHPVFIIKGKTWAATGKVVEDGFIVFKDSTVKEVTPGFKKDKTYYPVRVELEKSGVIKNGKITRNYVFKSSAQAGSAVACRPVCATKDWVTNDEDGRMFGDVYPKNKGEKKNLSKPVKEKKDTKIALEDVSMITINEDRTIERRGRVPAGANAKKN